ncbi:MAG: DUF2201 family putative metallopeptidase [Planctomycetota bacterium]
MSPGDKLMNARCRLMTMEPWYGHIAMSMTWVAVPVGEALKTMGVRIVNGGEIQCLYHPPFVEKLSLEELYAVVQHEIEHVVRLHCVRNDSRHPTAWNIAADMCVNGLKSRPRIGYRDSTTNRMIIPHMDQIVWIPEDWPENETTECYYEMILKKGRPDGFWGDTGTNNRGETVRQGFGRTLDDHDVWRETDVSMDEARQVVRDLVHHATEKCPGTAPGHLSEAINDLNRPRVNWRQLLRHYLGKHLGNRRVTFSRRNRRQDRFGMPGISRRAAATVNVIVDTSGSISSEILKQFFAEIECISHRAKTRVLQWDHAFQGWSVYRRGCWKGMAIHGRGGTDMAAPLRWLLDNRKIADAQVMLTDGFCNYLKKNEVQFPMITVITPGGGTEPQYGHVVRMK